MEIVSRPEHNPDPRKSEEANLKRDMIRRKDESLSRRENFKEQKEKIFDQEKLNTKSKHIIDDFLKLDHSKQLGELSDLFKKIDPQYRKAALLELTQAWPSALSQISWNFYEQYGLHFDAVKTIVNLQNNEQIPPTSLEDFFWHLDKLDIAGIMDNLLKSPKSHGYVLAALLTQIRNFNIPQQELAQIFLKHQQEGLLIDSLRSFDNLSSDMFWHLVDWAIKNNSLRQINTLLRRLSSFPKFNEYDRLAEIFLAYQDTELIRMLEKFHQFYEVSAQTGAVILKRSQEKAQSQIRSFPRVDNPEEHRTEYVHATKMFFYLVNHIDQPDFNQFFGAWRDIYHDSAHSLAASYFMEVTYDGFASMVSNAENFANFDPQVIFDYVSEYPNPRLIEIIFLNLEHFDQIDPDNLLDQWILLGTSTRKRILRILWRYERTETLEKFFNLVFPDGFTTKQTALPGKENTNNRIVNLLKGGRIKDAQALGRIAKQVKLLKPETAQLLAQNEQHQSQKLEYRRIDGPLMVGDKIFQFYLYEDILRQIGSYEHSLGKAEFDINEKLARQPQELSTAAKVQLADVENHIAYEIDYIFEWVRQYLISAIYSELRHQVDSRLEKTSTDFGWPLVVNMEHVPGQLNQHPVDSFLQNATHEQLNKYLDEASLRFEANGWRSNFGGSSWTNIAKLARDMWQGDLSLKDKVRLIDRAFDLEHNTGMIFDKRADRARQTSHDQDILTIKFGAPDIESVIDNCNSLISSKKEFSRITRAYRTLQSQVEKIKELPTRNKLGGD